MRLVITNIDYKAGVLSLTIENHPIGNEFNFKEVHDLIEEYGAVNELVFIDSDTDLNPICEVADYIRVYQPKIKLRLVSNQSTLDSLDIENTLRPLPFISLLMNNKLYNIK